METDYTLSLNHLMLASFVSHFKNTNEGGTKEKGDFRDLSAQPPPQAFHLHFFKGKALGRG